MRLRFPLPRFKLKGEHNIYEAAQRQKRQVMAMEAKAVARLTGAWRKAYAAIIPKLEAVTKQLQAAQSSGTPVSPAWIFQQQRWAALMRSIESELKRFGVDASSTLTNQQKQMVETGLKHSAALVKATGIATGFKSLPTSAFENVVGYLTDKSPLYDLFQAIAPDALASAREMFAVGISQGQNPRKIGNALMGKLGITKQRAVLIARTESLRAYRQAHIQNYAANSDVVVGLRISSARDGRTCPLCLARDGIVLTKGEDFAPHPGCRCALIPVVKFLDEPPTPPTGEDWLKAQPEAVQKATLGPSRFDLWNSGKISLSDIYKIETHPRWGKSLRARTLKEIQAGLGKSSPSSPTQTVSQVFPAPVGKTANEYANQLVEAIQSGALPTLDAAAILAQVKAKYPKTVFEEKHIVAKLKAATTAPVVTPASTVSPPTPKVTTPDLATVILGSQVGKQAGSNPGGIYLGTDGVQRYVKFYADPRQAHVEHLTNEIYRALGIEVPRSTVFEHQGQTVYASELLASTGTLSSGGLTVAEADAILSGFAADVLTANWDALGAKFDNIVRLKSGGLVRIDNGGSLLFRAKAGIKPDAVLNDIPEWSGFAPGGINPQYASVFARAGKARAEDIGKPLLAQIAKIKKLRDAVGGWSSFVQSHAPGLDIADSQKIAAMLEARTNLLVARAASMRSSPKKPRLLKGPLAPAQLTPRTLSDTEGAAKRKALYQTVYNTLTPQETAALSGYKGSGYRHMSQIMRGPMKPSTDPSAARDIEYIKKIFARSTPLDEDLVIFRGLGKQAWHALDQAAVGTTITDPAFISSTNIETFARDWASNKSYPVLLRMRIARGTVAIPSKNPSYHDGEHEFIWHGLRLRILAVRREKHNGKTIQVIEGEFIESLEGGTKWNRKIK